MTEGFMNARQAMAFLGTYTNRQAFNRAVHRYGIPHRYVGRRLVFERARLESWVRCSRRPESQKVA
jgi:hypothetical protein